MANYGEDLALIVRYDGTVDAFDAVKSSYLGKVVFITGSSSNTASNDDKKQAVWVSNGAGGKYLNMSNIDTIKADLEHMTKIYVGTQAYDGTGGVAYSFVGADGVGLTLSQSGGRAVITFSGTDLKASLVGTANDAEATPTIMGAKKYAQAQALMAQQAAESTASANTTSAISASETRLIGSINDAASLNTIGAAKKHAEAKANAAEGSAKAYTDAEIGEAKTALVGNSNDDPSVTPTIKGVYSYAKQTVDASKVTINESQGSGDVATQYTIKQGNATIGTIKIAKAMVIESGSIVDGYWTNGSFTENVNGTDKAIKLVLAGQASALYINVADLIDAYTAEANATQVQVAISSDNKISATLVDGGITTAKVADKAITKAKLDASVQTMLDKASAAYAKPSTGIPVADLHVDAQTAISYANSAVQGVTASTADSDYLAVSNGSSGTTRTIGLDIKTADIVDDKTTSKGLATAEDVRAYIKARLSVMVVS